MADPLRLLADSLTGSNPLEAKIIPKFQYWDLVTFAQNKVTPVYNWFYYKEGYSRDFVHGALDELKVPRGSTVLDPFCGTGTTLLASKEAGYDSVGFDILPLGVFVSRVKLEDGYDLERLADEARKLTSLKYSPPRTKLPDVRFIDMRKAFSPYARQDLAFFRESITGVDDELTRNFLMLGLISIVSQVSNVRKDGGVLKIVRRGHTPPVRHMLREKLKRMIRDLRDRSQSAAKWRAEIADARTLPLEDGTVDAVVTSPPYLNNIDYTKVYALELSLLLSSGAELEELRKKSLRSHVGAVYDDGEDADLGGIIGRTVRAGDGSLPQVVEGYAKDMSLVLAETARVLKPRGAAVYVVANAVMPSVEVDVDLMLAEEAGRFGLETEAVWAANIRRADIRGVSAPRPVRESAVVLRKP